MIQELTSGTLGKCLYLVHRHYVILWSVGSILQFLELPVLFCIVALLQVIFV